MADDARLKVILELKDMSAKGFKSFKNSIGAVTKSVFSLQGGLASLGLALTGREIFEAGRNVRQLQLAFSEITGSTSAMSKEFDFVRDVADRMGQNFYALVPAYKGILAASKDTNLEGEKTRSIFEGITKASASLGLSSEQTSGALRAIEQMMSKGKVQAEELRGQLGERLPGAFKLAAEAMGVTTAELNKMLDDGQVMAEDLLPKLAEVLKRRYTGEVEASTRAVNKMAEAWMDLKVSMAESGFLDSIAGAITNVADAFKDEDFKQAMSDAAENIGRIVKGLSGVMKYAGLRSIMGTASQGAELANKGLLDWEKFIRAGFLERQRMVDAILKDTYYVGGYADNDALEAAFNNRPVPLATNRAGGSDFGKDWIDAADEEIYGLEALASAWEDYTKKISDDARELIQTWDDVDAALERTFGNLDAEQHTIGIDMELDKFFGDLDNQQKEINKRFNGMVQLSQRTADAMEDNFSDLFFDAFTGQLKDLGDYWEAFCNSILRAWADIMGQMTKQWIFGGGAGSIDWGGLFTSVAGLFGGSSSYSGVGTYGVNPGDINWHGTGGVITGPIIGFDRSGNVHGFGDTAEVVVPLDRLGSGGGETIHVTNNFNISAIDQRGVEQFLRTNQARIAEETLQSLENRRSQRDALRSLM